MLKKSPVFVIYLLLVWAFYYHTSGAGFCFDFISWIKIYRYEGVTSVISHMKHSGFIPVYHIATYAMYYCFGLNKWAWFIAATGLHTLVGWLLYKLMVQYFSASNLPHGQAYAFLGGLLFLLSPNQVEAVVWAATLHYLISGVLILSILLLSIRFAKTNNRWTLLAINALFLIALFTSEATIVTPFILLAIMLLGPTTLYGNKTKLIVHLILPLLLVIGVMFAANMLFSGKIISHYGGDPLHQTSLPQIASNYLKYLCKLGGYFQLLGPVSRQSVFVFLEKPWVAITVAGLIICFAGYCIAKQLFSRPNTNGGLALVAMFSIMVAPFALLSFNNVSEGLNDRFSYLPSLFFVPMAILLLHSLLKRWAAVPLIAFLLFSLYLLPIKTCAWAEARQVCRGLVSSFHWGNANRIYLFNAPSYYKGIWCFASNGDFAEALKVFTGTDIEGKAIDVVKFNAHQPNDALQLLQRTDTLLTFGNMPSGSWMWHNMRGLTDYETADFSVHNQQWSYTFRLKTYLPNTVFLYNNGRKWLEIKGFGE